MIPIEFKLRCIITAEVRLDDKKKNNHKHFVVIILARNEKIVCLLLFPLRSVILLVKAFQRCRRLNYFGYAGNLRSAFFICRSVLKSYYFLKNHTKKRIFVKRNNVKMRL